MNSESLITPAISIVIPVYNECNRIDRTLRELVSYFGEGDAEIIFVDDGSSDGTVGAIRDFAMSHSQVTLLEEAHRGKAAAVLAGMNRARGQLVGFMDADLATPLDTWETCTKAIQDGAGVAIASREGEQSIRVDEPFYRHAMGRVFNWLVQLLLLPGIDDTQCGFKVFRRDALTDILLHQRLYANAAEVKSARVTAFDVELLYIARKRGYEIAIVPITWQYGEHSKVNPLTDTFHNVVDVLRVKWNGIRGHY